VSDPAWPDVLNWIKASTHGVEILPPDKTRREEIRRIVGVSLESALGAVIHETGGLMVDQGWLRILGSGSEGIPRIARPDRKWILVADDVVGGFFALHPPNGEVHYLAPDTAQWEGLGIGYSAWFRWSMTEKLGQFYQDYRGSDWATRVRSLEPHQAFHLHPPPWAAGEPFPARNWRNVPVDELYRLALQTMAELPKSGDVRLEPGP